MSIFKEKREAAGLTQEGASSRMSQLALERVLEPSAISRIENGRAPTQADVISLATVYHAPELYAYYCQEICPLAANEHGIVSSDLDTISDTLFHTMGDLQREEECIYQVFGDGKISNNEWPQALRIVSTLKKISEYVKALNLWATGKNLRKSANSDQADPAAQNLCTSPYARARKLVYSSSARAAPHVYIERSRLSAIEVGRVLPSPQEVSFMAQAYQAPQLYDYYCSKVCKFRSALNLDTTALEFNRLEAISLKLFVTLHYLEGINEKLHTMLQDAQITQDEEDDFNRILCTLGNLSYSADSLSLWMQRSLIERANELLADSKISPQEADEFRDIIQKLKTLEYDEAYICQLQKYLT
jgi:transcriptional regulator with XRE-family HTH domain